MAQARRIGLKEIRALAPGEIVWDMSLPGFGARRQQTDHVHYVLKYRNASGRQRWFTIGQHGRPWTPDTARDEAKRRLGTIVDGGDPVADKIAKRSAATVAELCDQYLMDAKAGRVLKRDGSPKKASTLAIDTGRIERHIKPLIGSYTVASVTREDIERLLFDVAEGKVSARIKSKKLRGLGIVKGGKTAASRTVSLLGAMFVYAIRKRIRADNPVRGVTLFKDRERRRRLTDHEYKALGDALRDAETEIWPPAVAVIRFLTLTGWRLGEALGLHWSELDLVRRTAMLGDTKTGRSMRPLSHAAIAVIREAAKYRPAISDGDQIRDQKPTGLVFSATRGDGLMLGFRKFWRKAAQLANLPEDVTPHTLRHSYASCAADLGYSDSTIAALLGHRVRTITSRYTHTADAVLLAAADAVANHTTDLMDGRLPVGMLAEVQQAAE